MTRCVVLSCRRSRPLSTTNTGRPTRGQEIDETGEEPPGAFWKHTLWTPAAFRAEYEEVAVTGAAIEARHVYVATVSHVTSLPVTRGVMDYGSVHPPGTTVLCAQA